jgi:ferrous iron transport protein A
LTGVSLLRYTNLERVVKIYSLTSVLKKGECMLLSDTPTGASFKVIKVALGKEVGKRLADMGFTEGAGGSVIRSGFFRGPLQVRIRDYDILIRRFEAAGIEVEPVGEWPAAHHPIRPFGGGGLKKHAGSVRPARLTHPRHRED